MRRREFIAVAGCCPAAWPLAARAQVGRRVPRIGYLMDRAGPPGVLDEGFLAGLRELGYVVGESVSIDHRPSPEFDPRGEYSAGIRRAQAHRSCTGNRPAAPATWIP